MELFKNWCNGIAEKTGGELAFQPFGAKDVVGAWQLFDAVKNGVLHCCIICRSLFRYFLLCRSILGYYLFFMSII